MNFQDLTAKEAAQTDSEKPEVPEDFICIDPQQESMVLQFLTTFNQSLREQALVHLKLCLRCRETADTMLDTKRSATTEPQPYLFIDKIVMSDHVS